MGSGSYSEERYSVRSMYSGYDSRGVDDVFSRKTIAASNTVSSFNNTARKHNTDVAQEMLSVGVRECRDSEEHPNSTPIIIALDVTGSMRNTPHEMIKEQLPYLMGKIQELGIPDPQLLFMAVGDHEWDRYPIQVGQFESDTDKILDTLESFVLEGGGGGNEGESYLLAWVIAGYHTEIDSWFQRHKKGFLFTIGDEPCLPRVTGKYLEKGLGYQSGANDIYAKQALMKASEQYNVYHVHISNASNTISEKKWTDLVGQNLLKCKSEEVGKVISEAIKNHVDVQENPPVVETKEEITY